MLFLSMNICYFNRMRCYWFVLGRRINNSTKIETNDHHQGPIQFLLQWLTKLCLLAINRPISIYQNSALNNRPLHEALGNKPHKLCSYSPEPRAEVYCLRLNFNISKLFQSGPLTPKLRIYVNFQVTFAQVKLKWSTTRKGKRNC